MTCPTCSGEDVAWVERTPTRDDEPGELAHWECQDCLLCWTGDGHVCDDGCRSNGCNAWL
jgi:hypothetical protein